MEEEQGQQEDWQARDARSGVAKVYAEAKRRSTLGLRVAAGWAVLVLIYACMDMAGIATVAPPLWEFAAGFVVVLLAALALSRTPGPLLGAAVIVIIDLVVVAYRVPELRENGQEIDFIATAIRMILAPVVLSLVVSGYFGCLSIQAFKNGFSPGADWRTRMNPMMLQMVVGGTCVLAVLLGVGTWFGAIRAGFEQTNVYWESRNPVVGSVELGVTTPHVEKAERERKDADPFLDVILLRDADENQEPPDPVYPENAKPIPSMDGLDALAKREVEKAYKYAAKHSDAECVLEGQGRHDRCRDDRCKHWARVFVRACLTKAKATENYCKDVPDPISDEAGLLWAQTRCAGRKFENCREVLYAVQGHWHPPDVVMKAYAEKKAADKLAAEKAAAAAKAAAEKAAAEKAAADKTVAEKAAAESAPAAAAPPADPPAAQ